MGKIKKIVIIGPLRDARKVFSKIAEIGTLHIEETTKFRRGIEIKELMDVADLLVRVRALSSMLAPYFIGEIKKVKTLPLIELKEKSKKIIDEIEPMVNQLLIEKKEIEKDMERMKEDLKLLSKLNQDLNLDLFESEAVFMAAGRIPAHQLEELREKIMREIPMHVIEVEDWEEGWKFVMIGVLKKDEEKLLNLLQNFKWIGVKIPKASGKVAEVIDAIKRAYMEKKERMEKIEKEIREIARRYYPKLIAYEEMLSNYYRVGDIAKSAGKTKHVFVIEGWIPKEKIKKLKRELEKISPGIYLGEEKFREEEAPAIVEDNLANRYFYSIASLIGPPSPGTINPTPMIGITFPLFFGMMLGDIGYGILLILISTVLKRHVNRVFRALLGKTFEHFSTVLLIAGITSTFFGFIFGEIFGDLGHGLIHPLLFDRLQGIMPLMVSSAIIGLVHLNIGILLGFWNELHHGIKALGKASWFLLQAGIGLLVVNKFLGLIIIALSIALMLKFEGIAGVLEIPSFVGNIFSYMRLAAIGLSSAGIAIAVNSIARTIGGVGGLLILIIGHAGNLLLGILDPFIQATRLHLVEFFTKFYEPARRVYLPFSLSKRYTGGELIW